jgi:AGCS family alanine or glycine:cation symporter
MLDFVIGEINNALYSYVLIILLAVAGIWFTFRTRFVQFRMLGEQFRSMTERPKDGKGMSSFRALKVSTASRVGTGNIIGVSTALCLGGFGSVFWMWVIALVGASSAFVEGTLAQIYKKKGENGSFGGPSYYIEKGLHCRPLAILFAVLLIVTYGVGFNMLASYNLQSTFSTYGFYKGVSVGGVNAMPWIIGLIMALLVGYCIFGGGKRISGMTVLLVPVMGVAYVCVSLVIVILNIGSLPSVFAEIFRGAFDLRAIFGGFGGSCVMYGIKRGLFSNEAGVGSAPNAAATADVSHPVKQGLVQVMSVFIDTVLVCSATAFMCMCSGIEPTKELSGAPYVQAALAETLGAVGPVFITVAMVLFAFTTLIGNLYYVNQCMAYISGGEPAKWLRYTAYVFFSLVIFLGAGLSADLLWNIADVTMGLMALINIPVIVFLGKYAFRALRNYEAQRKEGKDPTFRAKDIGLSDDTDYWQ